MVELTCEDHTAEGVVSVNVRYIIRYIGINGIFLNVSYVTDFTVNNGILSAYFDGGVHCQNC